MSTPAAIILAVYLTGCFITGLTFWAIFGWDAKMWTVALPRIFFWPIGMLTWAVLKRQQRELAEKDGADE